MTPTDLTRLRDLTRATMESSTGDAALVAKTILALCDELAEAMASVAATRADERRKAIEKCVGIAADVAQELYDGTELRMGDGAFRVNQRLLALLATPAKEPTP